MRFRPALVVALLVLVVSGAMVVADPSGSSGLTASGTAASTDDFERADPGLVVTIQLRENGNARWHVTHRYVVNGSNETAAFEAFASSVQAGETDVGAGRETYAEFASAASEATERRMEIRNAGWTSSRVVNDTGELTYSFTWTNFGQVRGEQVVVGDAFRSPDGTWFPRLYDGQRLIVRPPSELNIVQTPPDKGLNQRALVWDGYREFEPGYLSVVLERPSTTTTTRATTPTTTNATTPPGPGPGGGPSPFLLGVGFALLLVFVGAGSYFFARWQTRNETDEDGSGAVTEASSDGGSPPDSGRGTGGSTAAAAGASAGSTASDDGDGTGTETDSSSDASPGTAEGASAAAGVGDADDDASDDDIDEALLSDEERVLRLIERNGGRMKQANIVTETGWSNAKVSQLLSGMDEDDEIQKLRIGRENLITLPDENVADFGNEE